MPHRPQKKLIAGKIFFQTGVDMNHPHVPFVLNFANEKREMAYATRWNKHDILGIIAGLNKALAIYESRFEGKPVPGYDPARAEKLVAEIKQAGEVQP